MHSFIPGELEMYLKTSREDARKGPSPNYLVQYFIDVHIITVLIGKCYCLPQKGNMIGFYKQVAGLDKSIVYLVVFFRCITRVLLILWEDGKNGEAFLVDLVLIVINIIVKFCCLPKLISLS